MDQALEQEICANCKKEIPQVNYVMHTMHCSRNITLCKNCNEPIPKIDYETHREKCKKPVPKTPPPPPTTLEKSSYFQQRKAVEDQKAAVRRENYLKKHEHLLDKGFSLKETVKNGYGNTSNASSTARSYNSASNLSSISRSSSSILRSSLLNGAQKKEPEKPPLVPKVTQNSLGVEKKISDVDGFSAAKPKPSQGLLACKFCDLELPKLDLDEHENYCGSRTDKCLECGELVMFKHKQVHLDTNHGFLKLNDEPGPRPSWDSATQRSASASNIDVSPTRRRFDRFRIQDFDYDPMPYLPSSYHVPGPGGVKKKEGESYKEISRRLDCKTEYIRNLLHDSASITIPLRHNGAVPRNHFNHNKGPAPQPPRRRRNPPTELVIPCEFCDTPIPHEELIEHETGCRPDLARVNPRRTKSAEEDDYFVAPPPRSNSPDDEDLPCEFCQNMVPASQLWRHQLSCTTPA